MTTATESGLAVKHVVDVLEADGTVPGLHPGGIWDTEAPPGTVHPYVIVWAASPGVDVMANGPHRILTRTVIGVRTVVQGSSFPDDEAKATDDALHATQDQIPGPGRVTSCVRRQGVRYAEHDNDLTYRHQGGMYDVQVNRNPAP